MRKLNCVHLAGLLLAGVFCQSATAQDDVTLPQPFSELRLPTVTNAIGRQVGGWAVVRFSVLDGGRTANIRVLDIAPPDTDPAPAIEAVERWQFFPAERAREEIDWHNNESVVLFEPPEETDEARELFIESYEEIQALVEAEDLTSAQPASERLLRERASSAAEIGVALAQSAFIHFGLGDHETALRRVRLATDPRVGALEEIELLIALELRLRLESEFGRTAEALDTYSRVAGGFTQSEENPFVELGSTLQQLWENSEILEVSGSVKDAPWRFDIHRPIFTIANIDGNVRSIDAECQSRILSLEYMPDIEWQLPDTLGACTLYVNADPGTTFTFYEMLPEN